MGTIITVFSSNLAGNWTHKGPVSSTQIWMFVPSCYWCWQRLRTRPKLYLPLCLWSEFLNKRFITQCDFSTFKNISIAKYNTELKGKVHFTDKTIWHYIVVFVALLLPESLFLQFTQERNLNLQQRETDEPFAPQPMDLEEYQNWETCTSVKKKHKINHICWIEMEQCNDAPSPPRCSSVCSGSMLRSVYTSDGGLALVYDIIQKRPYALSLTQHTASTAPSVIGMLFSQTKASPRATPTSGMMLGSQTSSNFISHVGGTWKCLAAFSLLRQLCPMPL